MKFITFLCVLLISISSIAKVSVSGVSSGAFMALQLTIARSDLFSGAALIAGGPYACSQGNVYTALKSCMKKPENINTEFLVNQVLQGEALDLISPLKNLQNSRFLIIHGLKDQTVSPVASDKVSEQLKLLAIKKNINLNITDERIENMAHAWPTKSFGNTCDQQTTPWLNSCNVDIGQKIFRKLVKRNIHPSAMKPENLKRVPVEVSPASYLESFTYVYIPEQCRENKKCPAHIALHGCHMGDEYIGDTFAVHSGLNEWAEGSGVIVVYPQVKKSLLNPNGCWDLYGYTGANFAVKTAPQIQAIADILEQLDVVK